MTIVRGRRVVLADGERPASIHIDHERIVRVLGYDDVAGDQEIVDRLDFRRERLLRGLERRSARERLFRAGKT